MQSAVTFKLTENKFNMGSFASDTYCRRNADSKRLFSHLKQSLLISSLILILSLGWNVGMGQVSITTTTAVSENFNGMGASAAATLPTGFKIGTDWSTGTTATTLAYGTSGVGIVTGTSSGGAINWANGVTASSTDRALGFLSTGTYTSPKTIVYAFTNNTGITITSIQISWNYEKFRSGSRAYDWTFFHGSTSTATTAETTGNQSYAADAANTTVSNPPLSSSKSSTITGLSILNGATYYLRWTYTGLAGSTNGQGLGIDDFSITLTAPISSYTLDYNSNGSTSGSVPAASTPYNSGSSVTVLGNVNPTPLVKTGYTFNGWNTAAN